MLGTSSQYERLSPLFPDSTLLWDFLPLPQTFMSCIIKKLQIELGTRLTCLLSPNAKSPMNGNSELQTFLYHRGTTTLNYRTLNHRWFIWCQTLSSQSPRIYETSNYRGRNTKVETLGPRLGGPRVRGPRLLGSRLQGPRLWGGTNHISFRSHG